MGVGKRMKAEHCRVPLPDPLPLASLKCVCMPELRPSQPTLPVADVYGPLPYGSSIALVQPQLKYSRTLDHPGLKGTLQQRSPNPFDLKEVPKGSAPCRRQSEESSQGRQGDTMGLRSSKDTACSNSSYERHSMDAGILLRGYVKAVSVDGTRRVSAPMQSAATRLLVDQLLMEIYKVSAECRRMSTATLTSSARDSTSDDEQAAVLPGRVLLSEQWRKVKLQQKSNSELEVIVQELQQRVYRTGQRLAKHLGRRDQLRRRREGQEDVVTAHLLAFAPNHGEDTKMRFSVVPGPGDSGFAQWLSAMQMVARLPGGIPHEFRRTLWLTLADKHLQQRGVDWTQAERLCFSEWSNPDDDELGVQIVKDLHRTGCSLFCGQSNQAVLKRVLLAYARWNKAVGYCQGFNMLAALILQVMDRNEPDSVKVMIYLIEGVLPESYFANNLRGLSVDMAVFRDLLRLRLPQLSRHLEHLQNEAGDTNTGTSYEPPLTNVFTMQWFLTLFCNCLPQPTVLRVWDLIFLEGNEVLLRTALAIWDILEDRIMTVNSADEFYSIMGVLTREILEFGLMDSNRLIKTVVSLSFPELGNLRDKYMYNITPWASTVTSAATVARRGLRLFYTEDELDHDESGNTSEDDDEKLAVAAAFGISAVFRSPKRRSYTSSNNSGRGPLSAPERELALDVSVLKQQYCRLRERQRQAQIILTAACGGGSPLGSSVSTPSVAMNHLLLGKSALRSVKGRRLGPPPGAVPPPVSRSSKLSKKVPSSTSPNNSKFTGANHKQKSGESIRAETIHWKDEKRKKGSKEDHGETEEVDLQSAPSRSRSNSSSSSSSSTSTELCDDAGCTDSEESSHAMVEIQTKLKSVPVDNPILEQSAHNTVFDGSNNVAPQDSVEVLAENVPLMNLQSDFGSEIPSKICDIDVVQKFGDSLEEIVSESNVSNKTAKSSGENSCKHDVPIYSKANFEFSLKDSNSDINVNTEAEQKMTITRKEKGNASESSQAKSDFLTAKNTCEAIGRASPEQVVADVTEKLRLIMEHLEHGPLEPADSINTLWNWSKPPLQTTLTQDSDDAGLKDSSSSEALSTRESREKIRSLLCAREESLVESEESFTSFKSSALDLGDLMEEMNAKDVSRVEDILSIDFEPELAERAKSAFGDVEGVTSTGRLDRYPFSRQNSEKAMRIIRENSEILQRISAWQKEGRSLTLPEQNNSSSFAETMALCSASAFMDCNFGDKSSHTGTFSSDLLEEKKLDCSPKHKKECVEKSDAAVCLETSLIHISPDLPLSQKVSPHISLEKISLGDKELSEINRSNIQDIDMEESRSVKETEEALNKLHLNLNDIAEPEGSNISYSTSSRSTRSPFRCSLSVDSATAAIPKSFSKMKYKLPEMSPMSPLQTIPASVLKEGFTSNPTDRKPQLKWRPCSELTPPTTPMLSLSSRELVTVESAIENSKSDFPFVNTSSVSSNPNRTDELSTHSHPEHIENTAKRTKQSTRRSADDPEDVSDNRKSPSLEKRYVVELTSCEPLSAPTTFSVQTPYQKKKNESDVCASQISLGSQQSKRKYIKGRLYDSDSEKTTDDQNKELTKNPVNPFPPKRNVRLSNEVGIRLGLYPNASTPTSMADRSKATNSSKS